MFKIGDFSKLAQVSVKTLRYYAQLGLLKPAWIDRFTSYRYYTLSQLPRLNRILALKDLGFSLEQIQQLLHEDLSADELRGMLRMKQAELERQLQLEQARLRRVQARLRQIDQEGALPVCDVLLKRIPAQRVAGLRNVVADIYQVRHLFRELGSSLQAEGVRPEAAQPPLAIFYDAEYREQALDVEAALPFSARLPKMKRLVQHELPPVESMACAVHEGSLESLTDAARCLMTWVEANGYQVTGPSRTVYLQSDLLGEGAKSLVAEVQYPVQKKPTPIFISQRKENQTMEPKIVSKPAFTAVGLVYKGKNENNEIAQLWQEFNPRFGELKNVVDGAFGLCEMSDETGVFRYMAAFAVSDPPEVPPGMEVWKVPAQKYAVFTCTLPTIHEAYRYAFETWLPQSGYEYSPSYDFEYYDENFDQGDIEHSPLSIFIPIK